MKTIEFLTTLTVTSALASAWTMQQTQPAPAAPGVAAAQQPPAGGSEQLIATVTGVEGLVQVRENDTAPWQRAAVGMKLGQDAEFRTGPRSAVRFVIPPDHTITLDRLGTVKVLQAVNDRGVIKTQMGMKYGRTRYDIEAAGREHESTIVSPSSTLAVRGTRFSAYDQRPFPAQGVSLAGRVEFRDRKKRVNFGSVRAAAAKSKIDVNNANAASVALGEAVVDPGIRLARTEAEDRLVTTLLSSGATVGFDYDKGIRVVRGGQPPLTDAELIPTLPGALNFVLRWTAPGTDLNLGVFTLGDLTPNGQGMYPIGGLNTNSTGGEIPFDHRGGPNGGIEVGFWPANFPVQNYNAGSVHISGPNSPATLDIFLNGQRVTFTGPDGQPTQTASYTAFPVDPGIASGQAVGNLILTPPGSKPDRAQTPKSLLPSAKIASPMGPRPPSAPKRHK